MNYLGVSITAIAWFRFRTYLSIARYYVLYTLPNFRILQKTTLLKGTKKGKRAFVFANGPSVNKLDPSKILQYQEKGYDVFGVNSYINTEFAQIVKPNYYVFSDPAYFDKNLQLLTEERTLEVQEDMAKVIMSGARLFAPVEYCHGVTNYERYAFCDSENLFSDNVSNITKSRGYLSMTAYKALSIACYLGYDEIYICGFDNNYFRTLIVNEKNEMFYTNDHFYSNKQTNTSFHRVREDEGNDIGELLYIHHFLFKGLAKFSQMPIKNLDKSSLVNCFSKHHELDLY